MTIVEDQWSGLFSELQNRVNAAGRQKLLLDLMTDVLTVTLANFGKNGPNRPEEWPSLKIKYAQEKHHGDTTPTLILSGELSDRESFQIVATGDCATMTNIVPYADEHQFGVEYKKLPARPYYPVDSMGLTFTPYMVDRLARVVGWHFQV